MRFKDIGGYVVHAITIHDGKPEEIREKYADRAAAVAALHGLVRAGICAIGSASRDVTIRETVCDYRNNVKIRDLWDAFGDVPMDPETECLDAAWGMFPKGTHREDVWRWFEQRLDTPVSGLMHGDAQPADALVLRFFTGGEMVCRSVSPSANVLELLDEWRIAMASVHCSLRGLTVNAVATVDADGADIEVLGGVL